MGKAPKINLELSDKSLEDIKRFRAEMVLAEEAARTLGQDLKNIERLLKAVKVKDMATATGGLRRQQIGAEFRQREAIDATSRLGTNAGQTLANYRTELKLAKEGAAFARDAESIARAKNLNLRMSLATITKMTSLEEVSNTLAAAKLRLGFASSTQNIRATEAARNLVGMLQNQLTLLQAQTREKEKTAQAELRTQQAIQRYRNPNIQLERARADAGRRQTLERITGDGGAGLLRVQAAVSANYLALGAARNVVVEGIRFAADLDDALRNLQAIVVVTDGNLAGLKETILTVAEATKFTAVEVANAAVTLGQAGFSAKEIEESLPAVALLATATGTDLARSVDVVTSVLGVFNLEAGQTTNVVNTLTAAVNGSKIDIDKLALGIQYAGNTAADSGVSFEELTASLAAMSNAGIRSGSTLGTGMRQILISLQKPSEEFQATLGRLGITMADIDLRSNGLYGALKKLEEGGFTGADAIRSFEVRAASAFIALTGNLDQVVELERSFLNSNAAIQANETQMRSLTKQYGQFQSNLQAVVATGLEPMVAMMTSVFEGMSNLLQAMRQAPLVLQAVVTGVTALGVGYAAMRISALAAGLLVGSSGIAMLRSTVLAGAFAISLHGVTGAIGIMATSLKLLMGPIGWVSLAIGAGLGAFALYRAEITRLKGSVDIAQSAFDNTQGGLEDLTSSLEQVNERIQMLSDRSKLLTENQNLMNLETDKVREQFRAMGIEVGDNVDTVGELIAALQRLRGELEGEFQIQIGSTLGTLDTLIGANENLMGAQRSGFGRGGLGNDLQGDTRRGDPAVAALIDELRSSDTTLTRLFEIQADLIARQSEDDANLGAGGGRTTAQSMVGDAIQALPELIRMMESNVSWNRQREDIRNQDLRGLNRLNNPGIVGRVGTFGDNARSSVLAASQQGSNPIDEFVLATGAYKDLEAQAGQLKAEIFANTSLLPRVAEELAAAVEKALGEIQVDLGRMGDTAQAAAQAAAEAAELRFNNTEAGLNRRMGNATTSDEVGQISQQRILNSREMTGRRVEELKVDFPEDFTNPTFLARQDAIFEEARSRELAYRAEQNAKLAGFIDEKLALNDNWDEVLTQLLAVTTDTEGRSSLTQALIDNADARAALEMDKAAILEAAQSEIEAITLTQSAAVGALQNQIQSERDAAAEQLRLVQSGQLELRATSLQGSLAGTQTQVQAQSVGNMLLANSNAQLQTQSSGLDPAAVDYETQLAQLESDQQARQTAITEMVRSRIAAILDVETREGQVRIEDIRRQIEASTDDGVREALRAQLSEMISSQAAIAGEKANLLVQGASELAVALQEIDSQEIAALADVAAAGKADQIADAEAALALTDQALAEVAALAATVKTLYEEKELLKRAMILIARRAQQAQFLGGLTLPAVQGPAGMGTAPVLPGDDGTNGIVRETLNTINGSAARNVASGGGGSPGGGGGAAPEDPVDQLIERLGGQLEAASILVKAGEVTNVDLDATIAEASTKLQEVTTEISALQGRLLNGTLTADEQERLNTLVDQHGKLTSFVREQEEAIIALKIRQGDLVGGIVGLTQNWAASNLDMTDTFIGGFTSALSDAKSGMNEFFTTWSDGTKSGKDAFVDFGIGVVKSIQGIFAEMLTVYLLEQALGWLGVATGGGSGNFFTQALSSLTGTPSAMGTIVPDGPARDSKLYKLMPGEAVLTQTAVQAIGEDQINSMNAMGNREISRAVSRSVGPAASAASSTTNVYVVAPGQQPTLGPNDILAVISDDIMRGGVTKKLIKSVQQGA